ncbi:MAG: hypothetical protein HRT58_22380 [Crocinitomicaceae bacterium]|nr:hypothetical protein [Flavobacteriales bacterium]NQZ38425.1 hypothetical protein [Crocinitomicaceae bacterium]
MSRVASWPDGHCTYQVFSVRQDYDGAKYGYTYQYRIGDQQKIACENAK